MGAILTSLGRCMSMFGAKNSPSIVAVTASPSFPLDCLPLCQPIEFTHENIFSLNYYRPAIRQKFTLLKSLMNFHPPAQAIYRLLSALGSPF